MDFWSSSQRGIFTLGKIFKSFKGIRYLFLKMPHHLKLLFGAYKKGNDELSFQGQGYVSHLLHRKRKQKKIQMCIIIIKPKWRLLSYLFTMVSVFA